MSEQFSVKVKLVSDDFAKELERISDKLASATKGGGASGGGAEKGTGASKSLMGAVLPEMGAGGKALGGMLGMAGGGAVGAAAMFFIVKSIGEGVKEVLELFRKASPVFDASLKILQTAFMLALRPLGDLIGFFLLPLAVFMIQLFVPIIQALAPYMNQLLKTWLDFGKDLANIFVPFITGSLVPFLKEVMPVFVKVAEFIGKIGLTAIAVLIVGAIVGVVTAIALVYEGLAQLFNNVVKPIGVMILRGLAVLAATLLPPLIDLAKAIATASDVILSAIGSVATVLASVGDTLVSIFSLGYAKTNWTQDVKNFFADLTGKLKWVEGLNSKSITEGAVNTLNGLANILEGITLPDISNDIWDLVSSLVSFKTVLGEATDSTLNFKNSVLTNLNEALRKNSQYTDTQRQELTKFFSTQLIAANRIFKTFGLPTIPMGNERGSSILYSSGWSPSGSQLRESLEKAMINTFNDKGFTSEQNVKVEVGGIVINGGVGGLTKEQIRDAVNDGIANAVRRRRSG